MTPDKKYVDLVAKAREEYTEGFLSPSVFPEYHMFRLLVDVDVHSHGITVPARPYYVHGGDAVQDAAVYELTAAELDGPIFELKRALFEGPPDNLRQNPYDPSEDDYVTLDEDLADEEHERKLSEPVNFSIQIDKVRGHGGRVLKVLDLLVWLAANVQDDPAVAREIIEAFYGKPIKREALRSIARVDPRKVNFTTDKVNRKTWGLFSSLESGQLAFDFSADGSGSLNINMANKRDKEAGIERVVTYGIDFDGLADEGIAPRLDLYDRRVYEALSSLWNNVTSKGGQDCFALNDVYSAMGYTGNIGDAARRKINDSITKMTAARISVDNIEEADAYKYPHFRYDGSLLPMERITAIVDGQVANAVIHLFREPPLFTFARERKQVTTCSVKVLQSPLSKTDRNLAIEDYYREQIAWIKTGKRNRRITDEDAIKETNLKKKEWTRKRKDVTKLLNHYKEIGWIAGFEDDGAGFVINI